MELAADQKAAVCKWVEDGAGLNDVQRRIKDEFGISMTYMDVRFLVLDLGATIRDKQPAKSAEPAPVADAADLPGEAPEAPAEPIAPEEEAEPAEAAPLSESHVSVTLDKIVRAGALASGSVTFSDGVTGGWMLDRMGRLALTKISQPGYQPTDADLEAFQLELQSKLSAGY